MQNEEYIEKIKKAKDIIARKTSIPEEGETFDDISTAYDVAIDIMEKEIPRKVEIKDWSPAYCPRCGKSLSTFHGDGYYTHPTFLERCTNTDCAQRLKWPNNA